MPNENAAQLSARQANFTVFHQELAQVLVDFIGRIGIEPAVPVLKQAAQYVPLVEQALRDMAVADEADRTWLTARIAYFVGEVFVQQYDGCWYVNDAPGSPLHARYVVGKFCQTRTGGHAGRSLRAGASLCRCVGASRLGTLAGGRAR
ncbi:hypothetical protein [Janthinobacterium sp. AD80]|uniref:hypothetical protein n=1 Tax=Janthinobacterium sp. AD80 TaxID=1528773 RepID=UPI000C81A6E4|nr:hypothetical protein [Janthinobacterium sp. AD80]PMQ16906.1 hypothetical protein JaAD80_07845 [Janthinobacterium sp. AD80]